MELLFQHLTPSADSSFKTYHEKLPHFVVPWHYHPEIEIMYILKGEGTRFVGDSIEQFSEGDFAMVGSNIPHVWRNNNKHYQNNSDLYAECLVLFIPSDFFSDALLSSPEMSEIKNMFEKSKRGLKFTGKKNTELKQLMIEIFQADGAERLIKVIQLLHKMSKFKKTDFLCSLGYNGNVVQRDFNRLTHCIDHILMNFQEKIELNKVAELANMTPNSFCRYFKKRTTKTFSQFIIELRVGKACQLLTESEKKIIEIAFESGFNSLSNFNEHFNKIMKMSPRKYRVQNLKNSDLSIEAS